MWIWLTPFPLSDFNNQHIVGKLLKRCVDWHQDCENRLFGWGDTGDQSLNICIFWVLLIFPDISDMGFYSSNCRPNWALSDDNRIFSIFENFSLRLMQKPYLVLPYFPHCPLAIVKGRGDSGDARLWLDDAPSLWLFNARPYSHNSLYLLRGKSLRRFCALAPWACVSVYLLLGWPKVFVNQNLRACSLNLRVCLSPVGLTKSVVKFLSSY